MAINQTKKLPDINLITRRDLIRTAVLEHQIVTRCSHAEAKAFVRLSVCQNNKPHRYLPRILRDSLDHHVCHLASMGLVRAGYHEDVAIETVKRLLHLEFAEFWHAMGVEALRNGGRLVIGALEFEQQPDVLSKFDMNLLKKC